MSDFQYLLTYFSTEYKDVFNQLKYGISQCDLSYHVGN